MSLDNDRRTLIEYLRERSDLEIPSFDPTPVRFMRRQPPWYLRHASNRNLALLILALLFAAAMVASAH